MTKPIQKIDALTAGYPAVFFSRGRAAGAAVLGLTLLRPYSGFYGLLAVLAAYLFSRMAAGQDTFFYYKANIFNPLLTGLAVGYLFRLNWPGILLAVVLGVLTYMVTVSLGTVMNTYLKLPCLSLPFVTAGSLLYLAAANYGALGAVGPGFFPVDFLDHSLPLWLGGYFKALGAVFFMPHVFAGIVLALCIVAGSRILFFLSLLGYFSGTAFSALLTGSFPAAFSDINHFNSILTAMAIGGVFLIPSLKSYIMAMAAACACTVFIHGMFASWWFAKIPGVPLAFNIITLGFVYALAILNYPGLTRIARTSPEESVDFFLLNRDRPLVGGRTVTLPFTGQWTVWQGFDGKMTHKGNWKYAYDFIIAGENGESYRGGGVQLKDYHAFGKPVLSPVNGQVVKVLANLPDNPIGQPDDVNNWGNYVIIRDDRGFFVELSHFAYDSIRVSEGQRIERGGLLGLCGNSGFSSQPHIHLQVQLSAEVGAYTVPFCIAGFASGNRYHDAALPEEGKIVESLYLNPTLENRFMPALDQVYDYEVLKEGKIVDQLRLEVGMAADGTRYLDSGQGKLYFGKQDSTFYFYGVEGDDPYLKTMLHALPSFPLVCRQNLEWPVDIPTGMVAGGWRKAFMQFLASFSYRFTKLQGTLKCLQPNTVTGILSSAFPGSNREVEARWHENNGFSYFRAGSLCLQLLPPAGSAARTAYKEPFLRKKVPAPPKTFYRVRQHAGPAPPKTSSRVQQHAGPAACLIGSSSMLVFFAFNCLN
jgi:murein DD-endopeptidase MepM/ murein hydrolase activator NlpD/urea transporter